MSIDRFTFAFDDDWKVTVSHGGWQATRELRRVPGVKGFFPLPPLTDLPPASAAHHDLCSGRNIPLLNKAHDGIINRAPGQGGVERFGSYLFDTLIGAQLWGEITTRAAAGQARLVELALLLPKVKDAVDPAWSLHRLNWEMMHGPNGFLAAGNPLRVTISRLVLGAAQSERPLTLPPRMLFVIGSAITDKNVRPGAEYFGLLRQIEREGHRRTVHTRVLQKASPTRTKEVVRDFRPDIVHFICHGVTRADGRGCLQFELDEGEQDPRTGLRDALQLLDHLRVDDGPGDSWLPALVVLSACGTATLAGPDQTAPLAAELVAGGIPVVVGMAGRVSDQACRLFTRVFGEAIVVGQPLVTAVERGRRAAFALGTLPYETVDWSFPALYLAEKVAPDYAPTASQESAEETTLSDILGNLDVGRKPVFSARYDCLDLHYQALLKGKPPVLALIGGSGFGKTRLLQEITAQAVRDGQLPVLLGTDRATWSPPKTIVELWEQLLRAVQNTCDAFAIDLPPDSYLRLLDPALPAAGRAALPDRIQRELRPDKPVTAVAFQLALQHDLEAMLVEARKKHPAIAAAKGRPILLLDQLHEYDKDFLTDFFSSKLVKVLREFGLGADSAGSIPVVVAFDKEGAAHELLKPLWDQPKQRPWLRPVVLEPFTEGEDLLAYARVLLHPHSEIARGVSNLAWAINPDPPEGVTDEWESELRQWLDRIPDDFGRKEFYFWVNRAAKAKYLLPADDEDKLRHLP